MENCPKDSKEMNVKDGEKKGEKSAKEKFDKQSMNKTIALDNVQEECYLLSRNISHLRDEDKREGLGREEEILEEGTEICKSVAERVDRCYLEVSIFNAILELKANVRKLETSLKKLNDF